MYIEFPFKNCTTQMHQSWYMSKKRTTDIDWTFLAQPKVKFIGPTKDNGCEEEKETLK